MILPVLLPLLASSESNWPDCQKVKKGTNHPGLPLTAAAVCFWFSERDVPRSCGSQPFSTLKSFRVVDAQRRACQHRHLYWETAMLSYR